MSHRKRVALLIETSNAYARGLLEGIMLYQKQHDAWSIVLPEQERGAKPPSWLAGWTGDGIIARIENDLIAKNLLKLSVPIVDVSSSRSLEGIPWVETNDEAIARMGLEHLRSRGYQQFAFCGLGQFNWSLYREEHFVKLCEKESLPSFVYRSKMQKLSRTSITPIEKKRLATWLRSLPKPIGLMACYDIQAQIVLDVCQDEEIPVPDEIAVLGVDNDPLLCNLSTPSLSSVIPDAIGAGQLAAELLHEKMSGKKIAAKAHLMQPLGIMERQSTDVYAVADEDVVKAMKYIREHAYEGITVDDLLNHVPLSRRLLESRFRKATGRTPHEMISQRKLEKVEQLLRETDLSLEEIAKQCGFEYPEYMNTSFRKRYDVSPGRYRRTRKM